MRITPVYLVTVLAASASACARSADEADLEAARARWEREGLQHYQFVSRQTCFCESNLSRPINITVETNQIVTARYVDDQMPVADVVFRLQLTIDGAFNLIQDAIEQDAASLAVSYDEELGYPTSIIVDYNKRTADDERSLYVTELAAVVR
jgi:hypothetical protein